jgi:hypothetical protein
MESVRLGSPYSLVTAKFTEEVTIMHAAQGPKLRGISAFRRHHARARALCSALAHARAGRPAVFHEKRSHTALILQAQRSKAHLASWLLRAHGESATRRRFFHGEPAARRRDPACSLFLGKSPHYLLNFYESLFLLSEL